MIDFVNTNNPYLNGSEWLEVPELLDRGFPWMVSRGTGEVLNEPSTANYRGLIFKLLPSTLGGVVYRCLFRGSLHRYKNDGGFNHDRFTHYELIEVIRDLESRFFIIPEKSLLHGLEFGVNILLPYSTKNVFDAIVCHREKSFVALKENGLIGLVCVRDRYKIKVYDKGRASGVKDNLLRVEFHVNKMEVLAGVGVVTLADLTNKERVYALVGLLVDALGDIVFIPDDIDTSQLKPLERVKLLEMRVSTTWQKIDANKRYKRRLLLTKLLEKCKAFDYQLDLIKRVLLEWEVLFKAPEPEAKQADIEGNKQESKADKKAMFAPFKYTVRPSLSLTENNHLKKVGKMEKKPKKRKCKVCGKDISMNQKGSVFCSEKYNHGQRVCRAKDYNHRGNLKRKLMKLTVKDQYLTITYKAKKSGTEEAVTLHSSEVSVSREWLDSVLRIEVLPNEAEPALYHEPNRLTNEVLTGQDAVNILEQLTNQNQDG